MTEAERRTKDRRLKDHYPPCPQLEEHLDLERFVVQELSEIKETLTDVKGMLTVFKNTKGFITTIKWVGGVLIGFVALWVALSTLLQAIRIWVRG